MTQFSGVSFYAGRVPLLQAGSQMLFAGRRRGNDCDRF